jgi:hypothetical protein
LSPVNLAKSAVRFATEEAEEEVTAPATSSDDSREDPPYKEKPRGRRHAAEAEVESGEEEESEAEEVPESRPRKQTNRNCFRHDLVATNRIPGDRKGERSRGTGAKQEGAVTIAKMPLLTIAAEITAESAKIHEKERDMEGGLKLQYIAFARAAGWPVDKAELDVAATEHPLGFSTRPDEDEALWHLTPNLTLVLKSGEAKEECPVEGCDYAGKIGTFTGHFPGVHWDTGYRLLLNFKVKGAATPSAQEWLLFFHRLFALNSAKRVGFIHDRVAVGTSRERFIELDRSKGTHFYHSDFAELGEEDPSDGSASDDQTAEQTKKRKGKGKATGERQSKKQKNKVR